MTAIDVTSAVIGRLLAPAAVAVLAAPLPADTVELFPVKDNTLIETDDGSLSNGEGNGLFCGRVGNFGGGTLRRAVLAFDVAGNVPAGSTITSVTLTLMVLQSAPGSPSEPGPLHRLLADWGEGTSSSAGGSGAPSASDDATWLHTFYPDELWTTAGGDFEAAASDSITVGGSGAHTWGSTPEMVADVQQWLDTPASSFGWMIRGNEAELQTARKFGSKDNIDDANKPVLTIQFDPPACPWDCGDGDGNVGTPDFLELLAQWGSTGGCDFDGGGVGTTDFLELLANWGACP